MNVNDPNAMTQDLHGSATRPEHEASSILPECIGRYRIEKVLGTGGFGLVFLAHDEQLNRRVAVKVPHSNLVSRAEDADAYLAEARTVANLDHPNIAPVHDVGATSEFPCFVVSKYVEGTDLATSLGVRRPTYTEAAELVATVAEALHYAHKQGVVHRDVKPGNILIDPDGKPYVVDFGLALREENIGKGPRYAGTPAYMSPEQARGEGHRVDGRSDIFSLGVVLYELLVGSRPFRGDSQAEVLEHVTNHEPRPLRQYDEKIPTELERICHKAMAKRATERYSSAHDLAEDLRQFVSEQRLLADTAAQGTTSTASKTATSTKVVASTTSAASATDSIDASTDQRPIKIVPKGLRSFDAHDADFFLELLPGPRDRDGLPDSLRFWNTRIEETDPDQTFSVGLIYGPSGCGKSSLVKAGLLPRLSDNVISIYVEATPDETEKGLLHAMQKRCLGVPDDLNLKQTLAALRQGEGLPANQKVLIILDQFEQWLHAQSEDEDADLVQALRQCDGGRVQCLVMVRDDFWMAATRFMRALEIRLVESQNSAPVDLFPVRHAEKVLAAFGRAFGALSNDGGKLTGDQKSFVRQAVVGLAVEGKVNSVRLALFAEMMKDKVWSPATLKGAGGATGVGVTFLEETFSASTAPPGHRYHQRAVRAVLESLLPDSGIDIKGHMRSHAELLTASGYANRAEDFDELLNILDGETRLITPTDPEGLTPDDDSDVQTKAAPKYYQLAHDHLVHSLREWLTRKQKETRRGRAELRLAERAALWTTRPENRYLPSWWENIRLRMLTDKAKWTAPQRTMMAKTAIVQGIRSAIVLGSLAVLILCGIGARNSMLAERERLRVEYEEQQNELRGRHMVASLLTAETRQVAAINEDLKEYRPWADPLLQQRFQEAENGSTEKLHLALALAPADSRRNDYLQSQLVRVAPSQFTAVRDALGAEKMRLTSELWRLAISRDQEPQMRFQAAAALASYAPQDQRWSQVRTLIAEQLVSSLPSHLPTWSDAFQPVRDQLIDPLCTIYRDPHAPEQQRLFAADVLSHYAADRPALLYELIVDSQDAQFPIVLSSLRSHVARARELAMAELTENSPPGSAGTARPSDWRDADAQAVRMIESADGLINDECALAQSMTVEDFASVSEQLRKSGYRPIRFRPYTAQDGLRVAGIWHRDGRQWELTYDVNKQRLLTMDALKRASDWTLVDVAAYLPGNDSTATHLFCGLWVRREASATETLLRLDGEPEEDELVDAGFIPETCQFSTNRAGRRVRCSVWSKSTVSWLQAANMLASRFETWPSRRTDWDISIFAAAPPGAPGDVLRYAALQRGHVHVTAKECHGQTPAAHLQLARQYLREGYRPAAISVASVFDGEPPVTASIWHRPRMTEDEKERRAKRLANAAILLFQLGEPEQTWRLLQDQPDPGVRSFLIHRLSRLDVKPQMLVERLESESDASVRSALLMALGSYDRKLLSDALRQSLKQRLLTYFESDPVASVHSASRWLLRTLDEEPAVLEVEQSLRMDDARVRLRDANRVANWYVNTQGQTMVILDRAEFLMGAPSWEPQYSPKAFQHRRRIECRFAIAATTVTLEEFRRFIPESITPSTRSISEWAKTPDSPAIAMTWHEAAAFCNWLNKEEGIPEAEWCYDPIDTSDGSLALRPKSGFLKLTGYRLPTEAEWEYACRGGTETTRSYGRSESLLPEYAWYAGNAAERAWPVGSLKPNSFGLFDMHGNVWEWCQGMDRSYRAHRQEAVGEPEDADSLDPNAERALRGGAFDSRSVEIRSSTRSSVEPFRRMGRIGFRVARTMPSGQNNRPTEKR